MVLLCAAGSRAERHTGRGRGCGHQRWHDDWHSRGAHHWLRGWSAVCHWLQVYHGTRRLVTPNLVKVLRVSVSVRNRMVFELFISVNNSNYFFTFEKRLLEKSVFNQAKLLWLWKLPVLSEPITNWLYLIVACSDRALCLLVCWNKFPCQFYFGFRCPTSVLLHQNVSMKVRLDSFSPKQRWHT